jgi:16S rRNA (guanine966-N2)-methyltransferase
MRIIAGTAGGIPLQTPKHDVRPTTDRVREAVFSKLANILPGARIADLFAGSGAWGLEALSRGAAHTVFIEKNRAACEIIRRNAEKARLDDRSEIRCADVTGWLRSARGPFDAVFADPPYRKAAADVDFATQLLASPDLCRLMASNGIFVLESLPSRETVVVPPTWKLLDQRTYGSSAVSFLRLRTSARPDEG